MKEFIYDELVGLINKIEITMEGTYVVTYFDGRERSRKEVSNRYEIFDFKPFVINCIDSILQKYEIDKYTLSIVGGRQEIRLYSRPEVIKGETFTRTFYLLNSSDKSRALSFNYGLKHNYFQYISSNGAIYKKHYKGIVEYVEERIDLDDTIFQEQLELMRDIIGDTISMSNVQKLITGSDVLGASKISLRNNFESFLTQLFYNTRGILSDADRNKLSASRIKRTLPRDFTLPQNNFQIDSFIVFKTYLGMFNRVDASLVRRESARIAEFSTLLNRNNLLDSLLEEIEYEI